jgi:hypothetical protein
MYRYPRSDGPQLVYLYTTKSPDVGSTPQLTRPGQSFYAPQSYVLQRELRSLENHRISVDLANDMFFIISSSIPSVLSAVICENAAIHMLVGVNGRIQWKKYQYPHTAFSDVRHYNHPLGFLVDRSPHRKGSEQPQNSHHLKYIDVHCLLFHALAKYWFFGTAKAQLELDCKGYSSNLIHDAS